MSKYGVSSGPYFPVFGLNTEIYSIKKTEKTLYFGTFHAVNVLTKVDNKIALSVKVDKRIQPIDSIETNDMERAKI